MKRREFINKTALSVAGLSIANYALSNSVAEEFVTAETAYGKIKGYRETGVNIFKGVPYAGKISGERRFRRPAPLEAWTGVRDALTLGAPSIQSPNQTRGLNEPKPNEDCLFLNVWTPANDNKKRAVMFYSHGGGFANGSGGAVDQDGANLARFFDVVVVQTNHRLGIMGFLYFDEIAGSDYEGSGNNGTLDIADGLKWVNQNIEKFGGDPNNVMIFGESGGGGKTSCLYAMPSAAPYFNKASIESGPGVRMLSKEAATAMTEIVLKELNIAPKDWKKILDVPDADLLNIQMRIGELMANSDYVKKGGMQGFIAGSFSPVVDGKALPHHPFDPTAPNISKNKPLLVGWNEDEYTFFAMVFKQTEAFKSDFTFANLELQMEKKFGANTKKIIEAYRKSMPNASVADIFIAIESINIMGLGSVTIAERKVKQQGASVYLYNFGYKSESKLPGTDYAMGTPHAMDITFKFNNEVPPKSGETDKGGFLSGKRSERFEASHNFAELWTNFAKTGKPFAKNAPEWKAYNLIDRTTMRIDTKLEVINDRFKDELKVWREMGKL